MQTSKESYAREKLKTEPSPVRREFYKPLSANTWAGSKPTFLMEKASALQKIVNLREFTKTVSKNKASSLGRKDSTSIFMMATSTKTKNLQETVALTLWRPSCLAIWRIWGIIFRGLETRKGQIYLQFKASILRRIQSRPTGGQGKTDK